MSMSVYAFSDRQLSIAEWQAAIDAQGFGVKLDQSRAFAELSGFLPVHLDGHDTGFECDHADGKELLGELAAEGFPASRDWKYALCFNYQGDQYECSSACLAAASYVAATDGTLFESEEAVFYEPQGALEFARKTADPAAWAMMAEYLAKIAK